MRFSLAEFLTWYLVFLVALVLHEAAHALAAYLGGDETAYRGGQVTLNPLPHIQREPFGTVLIPIVSYLNSGWMMGWASAPYDPGWARRYPLRQAAMSAAGPAANLLLALLAFGLLKGLMAGGLLVEPAPQDLAPDRLLEPAAAYEDHTWLRTAAFMLSITLNLNYLLFLFNLLPLPPLDGSGILSGLLPRSYGRWIRPLAESALFSLVCLVIAWKIFDKVYPPLRDFLLQVLYA